MLPYNLIERGRNMSSKKFLVGVDGSYQSLAALKEAVQMAKGTGASLVAVYVEEEAPLLLLEKEAEHLAEERWYPDHFDPLAVAVEYGKANGVEVKPVKIRGFIAGAILKVASDEQVDMIFLGESGRTGLQRLALGSVAEGVARHAKVPVVIVKKEVIEIGDVLDVASKAPKLELETQVPEETPAVFRPSVFYRRMFISFMLMLIFLVYYLTTTVINSPVFTNIASTPFLGMPLGLFLAFLIYPIAWIISWIYIRAWR